MVLKLSYRDITEKVNISYENVRKRISQGRAILRSRLTSMREGKKAPLPRLENGGNRLKLRL